MKSTFKTKIKSAVVFGGLLFCLLLSVNAIGFGVYATEQEESHLSKIIMYEDNGN